MKRGTYFRLLALSLIAAGILSALSLFLLNRLTDLAASRHRNEFLAFLVNDLEQKLSQYSNQEIKNLKAEDIMGFPGKGPRGSGGPPPPMPPPPMGSDFVPGGPPPGGFRGPRPPGAPPRPDFWLVTEAGETLLATTESKSLPKAWNQLPRSTTAREIVTMDDFLHIAPTVNVIRMNRMPVVYFVMSEERRQFSGPLFMTQAALTFATVMIALVLAFTVVFFYLRRKSEEARAVLLKLERGELNARFDIKRFDEFGGLLLDFNRMAHEIERLVTRVHTTERTRKNLLQELGHDLRTPLTSLATSFETLRDHYDKMSVKDRAELFEMTSAEVEYFKDLLEKLMTIASLDEPNYKQSTELIDLRELLAHEVRARATSSRLKWDLLETTTEEKFVSGDAILLLRMIKNALDNSARYARTKVVLSISQDETSTLLQIVDDGPGLSPKELEAFAKRRGQRSKRQGDKLHFSLGLGSVIMKAIADLHGGSVEIRNGSTSDGDRGAFLTIRLPKISQQKNSH